MHQMLPPSRSHFSPHRNLGSVGKDLEDVELDEELVGSRKIVNEGEEFTWDTLIDSRCLSG